MSTPRSPLPQERQRSNEPEHDFPPGVARPALRALHEAGYTQLDQLTTATEAELSELHGMGLKALGALREALAARNLSLAEKRAED